MITDDGMIMISCLSRCFMFCKHVSIYRCVYVPTSLAFVVYSMYGLGPHEAWDKMNNPLKWVTDDSSRVFQTIRRPFLQTHTAGQTLGRQCVVPTAVPTLSRDRLSRRLQSHELAASRWGEKNNWEKSTGGDPAWPTSTKLDLSK